jgi:hypothetical protein
LLTDYHAKYYAHELTRQASREGLERLSMALFDANVDLKPHQIEAALFTIRSPVSKGVILAGEVGLGTDTQSAAITFFKITGQRTRLDILEALLGRKCGTTYNAFWNSFKGHVSHLDSTRNCVAHWHTAMVINDKGAFENLRLVPAYELDPDLTTQFLGAEGIDAFSEKCRVLARLCMMFCGVLRPTAGLESSALATSLNTCQQPITYPIPQGHPLYESLQKQETLPQVSQE